MGNNIFFWKVFGRRTLICFILMSTLFLTCILRIASICKNDYTKVSLEQNYYKFDISNLRGTIFDRNMIPLTNNIKRKVAIVPPTPRAITSISEVLEEASLTNTLNTLQKGYPIIFDVENELNIEGVIHTEIFQTDMTKINHIIGYCDKDGNGLTGIEKAYDDFLNKGEKLTCLYEVDAKGKILEGVKPTLESKDSIFDNGIITTIDYGLQNIAENYANYIEKGAIVIADAKTSKILASVSRPNINFNDQTNTNSQYLNRAINAYCVGSVFKPCVAIAGIENNKSGFIYNCTGECKIIDRVFKCHDQYGHGETNLKKGLANSCNTFFYNYSFNIGPSEIYNTAKNLLFGKSIIICEGIRTAKGSLPNINNLENKANLANFSIGQGELTLSPVSMITLYSAIANNGLYHPPTIIEGILNGGKIERKNTDNPIRAMKKETAEKLKEYLKEVLDNGTGKSAKPKNTTAAGKTATAQTGKFQNGREICSGWFCGFFPYEEPKYVVIIFSEDINLQTKTCSEIFSQIADEITDFE